MNTEKTDSSMEQLKQSIEALEPMAVRSIEEAKKLAAHFQQMVNDPLMQSAPKILRYLVSLDERNKKKFLRKRDEVEVEYVYPSETKNNQQRQRFNSLSVAEVSELLKLEFASADKSIKVHICTECDVEIETNEEEPLMESLQKHFNLEVHQPKRVESADVSEPIFLPNLSRRKSAMVERGEAIAPAAMEHLEQVMKENLTVKQKPDKRFTAKLETFLVRNLLDNSEASLNESMKLYYRIYDRICKQISELDLSKLINSVAPIIMSIKDNVDQNFSVENKQPEEENNDKPKNQVKKPCYYGPIETGICKFLSDHKLLGLVDDRTTKPAFFCMACEYYSLRFRYDSVLNHVFSATHIHNLSTILQADDAIAFPLKDRSIESISEMNRAFIQTQGVYLKNDGLFCELCETKFEVIERAVLHILDEYHLGRLSDKLYNEVCGGRANSVPEQWGQQSPDWSKHLTTTGRMNMSRDTIIIENFIKPSSKVAHYCPSCDMTLKGPRQVLFSHIRQKKHLRNVAPEKLNYLFKNHCRPADYYASFGKYYLCSICPDAGTIPSFSMVVEHAESDSHVESVALLIKAALFYDDTAVPVLKRNGIEDLNCSLCSVKFASPKEAVVHLLGELRHGDSVASQAMMTDRKDLISVYMKGNYILFAQNGSFTCVVCKVVFASVRSLLMHLVYADHVEHKPSSENVFRFYLELKYNIALIVRNKYSQPEFGALHCGSCERPLVDESAQAHTMLQTHRDRVTLSNNPPAHEQAKG